MASFSSSPLLHPHPSSFLFPDRCSFPWSLVTSPGPLRSSPPTTPLVKYLWPDLWTEKSWTATSSRLAATPSIPRALSPSARPGDQLPMSPSTMGQAAPLRAKSMRKADLGKMVCWKGSLDPEQEAAGVVVPAVRARRESLAADGALALPQAHCEPGRWSLLSGPQFPLLCNGQKNLTSLLK